MARYTLMNKNTPVLVFDYDLYPHVATRIVRIENLDFAPMGMADSHGQVSKRELNYWWRHRAIPATRAQIGRLLDTLIDYECKAKPFKLQGVRPQDQLCRSVNRG